MKRYTAVCLWATTKADNLPLTREGKEKIRIARLAFLHLRIFYSHTASIMRCSKSASLKYFARWRAAFDKAIHISSLL